jgi:DNA-binding MarR family transcriptional regulator
MSQDAGHLPEELLPLVSSLKRFATAVSADLMEVLFRLNLTLPQIRVLHAIRKESRMSGRQLARELRVSPAAVVQVCDRLEEQGFLERVPDLQDRRVTWFQLASSTQNLFEQMLALRRSRLVPALMGLSQADRENLVRMLNEMATVLESERESNPSSPSLLESAAGERTHPMPDRATH